jgi:MoxR-like ATPase
VLEPIKRRLVGKDEIVEVMGVSLIAGENTFLLGPPGTGKSALVQELASRLNGRTFDYLLTRFTEPSELFGPFDLRRLREGDLVTNTEGMLPEADFVFLDELLNANSAVLNSLLMALNERIFRRGRQTSKLPMLLAIGASNRLPEDEALGALFDRFLLRVHCGNVDNDRLGEVLDTGWQRESTQISEPALSIDDAKLLQAAIAKVDLAESRKAYIALLSRLREAGMPISDRRAVRLQRVLAASAIVCGRQSTIVSDLWVLRYIWDNPAQMEMLNAHVESIVKEFNTEENAGKSHQQSDHPLARPDQGPEPELLSQALELIASDIAKPSAVDSLALLAARIEWVKNSDSREHLRGRVAEIRNSLRHLPDIAESTGKSA